MQPRLEFLPKKVYLIRIDYLKQGRRWVEEFRMRLSVRPEMDAAGFRLELREGEPIVFWGSEPRPFVLAGWDAPALYLHVGQWAVLTQPADQAMSPVPRLKILACFEKEADLDHELDVRREKAAYPFS